MPRITPNLWFDTKSRDAAEFYVSVFPKTIDLAAILAAADGAPS
jgi:predicted 3-demethylubiquinone-9 3-methyltransferase (glyoxalase superfamily)